MTTTTTTRNAKVAADSAKLAASLETANGNPATEINPATGRKRAVATPKQAIAKTDSAGKVTKVAASKPAASKPAAEPKPKTVPASRVLARQLVETVAEAFANASDADKQRVANYLKIVTTGTDEDGRRWWVQDFPRPTHFSWA
jgi:hypothetical protein